MLQDLKNLSLSLPVINIIFIGHVDSGKSTICGRILLDLGLVDSRTIEKYREESKELKKASWYLSFIMDLNPEEREKGKTSELGLSSFFLKNRKINIIDSPGHTKFIHEMIEGTNISDVAILILSARNNEFESGLKKTTKEQLRILTSKNIKKLGILINKMDAISWDSQRFSFIKSKIEKILSDRFSIQIIPVSGMEGDNVTKPRALDFYKGPTFLEYLDTLVLEDVKNSYLEVVERIKLNTNIFYIVKNVGVQPYSVNSDYKALKSDDSQNTENLTIQSISSLEDLPLEKTLKNDFFKIKISSENLNPGDIILHKNNSSFLRFSSFYAEVKIFETKKPFTIGSTLILHINLQTLNCKVIKIYTQDKKILKIARKNEKVICLITTEACVLMDKQKKDRFSLRDEDVTIGIGQIRKISK